MEGEPGVDPDRFREALSRWASGVAVAAVRDEGRVLATTVTALLSLTVEPPLLVISLGPGAQILPFLAPGGALGVSILGDEQARIASVFADAFPVGASPFAPEGDPVVEHALVRLGCRVERLEPAAGQQLVILRVVECAVADGDPLVRFGRAYRRLGDA